MNGQQKLYRDGTYAVDWSDFEKRGPAGIVSDTYHLRAQMERNKRFQGQAAERSPVNKMTVTCDVLGMKNKSFSSWAGLDGAVMASMLKTDNAPYTPIINVRVVCEWENGRSIDTPLLIGRHRLPSAALVDAINYYTNFESMSGGKRLLNRLNFTRMKLHLGTLRTTCEI